MKLYVVPQLKELPLFIIFQLVGVPQYWTNMCSHFLMTYFLADGLAMVDQCLALWSPDAMPLDFFLWGCVKYYVYMSSVDVIGILCAKIIEASRVWWKDC